jgi:activating signal cointegrator complex subunit 1
MTRRENEEAPTPKERETFDAREILSMYGSITFEEKLRLESLHLSQRGIYGDDGYYKCIHKWNLP